MTNKNGWDNLQKALYDESSLSLGMMGNGVLKGTIYEITFEVIFGLTTWASRISSK